MANLTASLLAAALLVGDPAAAQNREPPERVTIEATLERFVFDYAQDPMAEGRRFGIDVDGYRWIVVPDGGGYRLEDGFGDAPLFYFKTDRETLNLLDSGVWNGLTAMGAATSADQTPLDILYSEDFEKADDHDAFTRRLIFHFWTKGPVEVVNIGLPHARVVHGAPATALYYDKDFRSAVYEVPAGLGREQAPTIAVPFPRMVIITRGSAEGEMDGHAFTARAGQMLFAPPNTPVTFWNGSDSENLQFVWLMWGEGA